MYLIIAKDHKSKEVIRESLREKHREHLKKAGKKLISSGALLNDEGDIIIGGFSILNTQDKTEAESFAFEDPYHKAGIRKETQIIRWRQRWKNGSFFSL